MSFWSMKLTKRSIEVKTHSLLVKKCFQPNHIVFMHIENYNFKFNSITIGSNQIINKLIIYSTDLLKYTEYNCK